MNRIWQLLISFDQFLNCLASIIIGGGWADETFSARCWRQGKYSAVWNSVRIFVDTLLFFDKQHCFTSYISEYERKHLPNTYSVVDSVLDAVKTHRITSCTTCSSCCSVYAALGLVAWESNIALDTSTIV
jgi:NADH:ubiquinone oxidoreductase subunit F (NADH-binding)